MDWGKCPECGAPLDQAFSKSLSYARCVRTGHIFGRDDMR